MAKTKGTEDKTALIEVPLGNVTEQEYLARHVEVRFRTVDQQRTFRAILRGLQERGAKTKDGLFVTKPSDALRWLMEQV